MAKKSKVSSKVINEEMLPLIEANEATMALSEAEDTTELNAEIVTLVDINGKAVYPRTTTKAIVGYGASNMVVTDMDQEITSIKTFTKSPIVPTPIDDTQATNKLYVDQAISGATPTIPTNLVTTDTKQEITGIKTFTNIIVPALSNDSLDNAPANKKYVDDSIAGIDLSVYATISSLDNYLTKELAAEQYATIDALSDYVTNTSLTQTLSGYATNSSLSTYATKTELDNAKIKTETITLTVAGWNSSLQQTITLSKVSVSSSSSVPGSIIDFPLSGTSGANSDAYSSAGIKLISIPANNQLTFKCTTKPTVAIQTKVMVFPE